MNLSRNDLKNIMIKFYIATNGKVFEDGVYRKDMWHYMKNIYTGNEDIIGTIESEFGKWSCYYTYINYDEAGFEYIKLGRKGRNIIQNLRKDLRGGIISSDEYEKRVKELPEYIPKDIERKDKLLKLSYRKIEDVDLEYNEYIEYENRKAEKERQRIKAIKDEEFKKKFEKSKKGWFGF